MSERRFSRRTVLKVARAGVVVAAFEQGPQLADIRRVPTRFAPLPGQERLLGEAARKKTGVWLKAPGFPTRGGRSFAGAMAEPLKQALADRPATQALLDRPMWYVDYGNRSHDPEEYARLLAKLQRQFGRIAFVGHSMGVLMLGSAAGHMDEPLQVDAILGDCTPYDDRTTRLGWAHAARGIFAPSWYPGGTFETMIADWTSDGNPFFPSGSAHLALEKDEEDVLLNGGTHLRALRNSLASEAILFARLSPEDPNKDHVVNPVKSVEAIRTVFPDLVEAPVGGEHQGHGNPWKNPDGYASAIAALPWQDVH